MAKHQTIVLKLTPKTGKPDAEPQEQEIQNLKIEDWEFIEVDDKKREIRRFTLNDYWKITAEARAWEDRAGIERDVGRRQVQDQSESESLGFGCLLRSARRSRALVPNLPFLAVSRGRCGPDYFCPVHVCLLHLELLPAKALEHATLLFGRFAARLGYQPHSKCSLRLFASTKELKWCHVQMDLQQMRRAKGTRPCWLVCADCVDSLDKQWASSTATEWVLICWNGKSLPSREYIGSGSIAETWPSYTVYRNTSYARMKSLWATWSEQIRAENERTPASATSSISNRQPDPDEVQALWQIWSKKPDAPFIRPANPDELRFHNGFVEAIVTNVTKEVLAKWGYDDSGKPISTQGDYEAREQAVLGAVVEIRNRLEGFGMLTESEWDSEEWRAAIAKGSAKPPKDSLIVGRGLSQVAGMADLKEQLMHEVIGPFKDPELYRRYRVSLPNGILFYGPPGCGKTYVARSLAEELGWSFQYCRPSDVASPYIHDTVSRIRGILRRN